MIPRTALAAALFAALAFSQARPSAQPANRMEITLERLDGDNWHTIDPGLVLEQGDRVRFRFRTNFDGYLYVTNQSTSRQSTSSCSRARKPARTTASPPARNTRCRPPPAAFRIAGPAGHEMVYWLVSPARLTDGAAARLVRQRQKLTPPTLIPRCDDTICASRGDCIDHSAGPKLVPRGDDIAAEPRRGRRAQASATCCSCGKRIRR